MWNPEKILIRNLFAHKNSEYEFKNNACTVIFGRNETDKGLENNGSGKTTLFEGICIALTNDSLRAIKKDNFINREEEECEVDLTLYNPVLKRKFRIRRKFFRGNKPVKVEIWDNDVLNKQLVSVNEANKYVFELLGISREDLLRYYIISQDSRYTFFTASDVEKKEILNRITSADMINPIIDDLDLKISEKQGEYNTLIIESGKVISKKDVLLEQREEVVKNDNTDSELELIKSKRNKNNELIDESKKKIDSLSKSLLSIQTKILNINVENVDEYKQKKKSIDLKIQEVEKMIRKDEGMKNKIEAEIDDTIVCPECKHEFIRKSELGITLEQAKTLLNEVKVEISNDEKTLNKLTDEYNKLVAKIAKISENIDEVNDLNSQKKSLEIKRRLITEEMYSAKVRNSKLDDEEKLIKEKKKDNRLLKSIDEKIKECDISFSKIQKDVALVENDLNMIKFWRFNMGKSGFMTYLANKSLKIIEGATNTFLKKFGVDITVLINGFTILKSGEVREKIDTFISTDGINSESFLSKSGGERGRVSLAGVLGIHRLINLSTGGRGLNLLCFDECFHGMDSRGQENIINILEKIGITTLVITQNVSESFNNENTLMVVKRNDISEYVRQS